MAAKSFESSYSELKRSGDLPSGLVRSFLLKSQQDPEYYIIETVWESVEALERMRSSTEMPAAVRVFKEAGATPTVELMEVRESIR